MQKIKGFDGIRAISVLLVIMMHLGLGLVLESKGFPPAWYQLFSGDAGVRVFFVLSGFLITSILLDEQERNHSIHLGKFYMRRALRLVPPMLIFAMLILLTIAMEGMSSDWVSFSYAFLYAYNYVPIVHYQTELGHMWSLGVEEQFYLLWPLALILLRKRWLLLVLLIGLIVLCLLHPYAWASRGVYFGERFFIPAGISIFFGSALALIKPFTAAMSQWTATWRRSSFVLALLIYILSMNHGDTWVQLIGFNITICFMLLWIYWFQESRLVKMLEWPPLAFIGSMSYGLYLYQGLFLRTGPGGELAIQQFPINLMFLFAVALISYFTIEKWAISLKKKWS